MTLAVFSASRIESGTGREEAGWCVLIVAWVTREATLKRAHVT